MRYRALREGRLGGLGHWWLQSLAAERDYVATLGGGNLPMVGGTSSFARAFLTAAAGNSIPALIGDSSSGSGVIALGAGDKTWKLVGGGGAGFGPVTGSAETGLWKTVGSDFDGDDTARLFTVDPATVVNTLGGIIDPVNALLIRIAGGVSAAAFYARPATAPQRAVVFGELDALAVN
jgi:hypothetical protein